MLRKLFRSISREEDGGIDIGNILLLAIGLIFIAVGFIIYPVILDGVEQVLDAPTIDSYTGLGPVASVAPLIVLIGFVTAGVVTGFFGLRNIIRGR